MKVLGICGSPRKGGNTDILLTEALKGAGENGAETEKIILSDLNISPCQEKEYENIDRLGLSVVVDDMHLIYRKIMESDVLIVASPIFFGSITAQLKIMIDRFQCVWVAKNKFNIEAFAKKMKGGFICVEATSRDDFFENAKSIVKNFFTTINVDYTEDLLCINIDKKGNVWTYPDCIEKAYKVGQNLV